MSIRSISLISFIFAVGCATPKGLPADQVQKAIQFRARDYVACFEENYKRPTEGRYRLSFTIGADGSVHSVSPDREQQTLPKSGIFDDCMVGVLKEIPFPTPAGAEEVQVNYPFYFRWGPEIAASTPSQPPSSAPAPDSSPVPKK